MNPPTGAADPVIDVDSICLSGTNQINVAGGSTITTPQMLKVWAKAVPASNAESQNSPWDDTTTNPPTEGTVGTGNTWSIPNIPLSGTTNTYKVYVWALYDGQSGFSVSVPETFTVSGTGAIGSCTEAAVAARLSGIASVGALPRAVQIRVDSEAKLPGEFADLNDPLELVFDEALSGRENSPVWVFTSKTGTRWALEVKQTKGTLSGQLVASAKSGDTYWTGQKLKLFGKSLLAPQQADLPEIVVEPA